MSDQTRYVLLLIIRALRERRLVNALAYVRFFWGIHIPIFSKIPEKSLRLTKKKHVMLKKQASLCHFCNLPMIETHKGTSLLYFGAISSLDHFIIMKKDGGTKDEENCKLAHSWCNSNRHHLHLRKSSKARGFLAYVIIPLLFKGLIAEGFDQANPELCNLLSGLLSEIKGNKSALEEHV